MWIGSGAIACWLLACLVLVGWPLRPWPRLDQPFIYSNDGLSHLWMIKRVMEGWIFDNSRSGFPFGSSFLDYPGSETGTFLVIKVIGWLAKSPVTTANVYFLLGFPTTFVSTYLCCRVRGTKASLSLVVAVLFAFAPYHFARLLYGHLFYTWYFHVPIFFHIAIGLSRSAPGTQNLRGTLRSCIALALLSCFGAYFAVFGAVIIIFAAITGACATRRPGPLLIGMAMCVAMILAVIANVSPSLRYWHEHGRNAEVAQRNPIESEVYGLKIMHLLEPQPFHRIGALAQAAQKYSTEFPLSNTISSLGFVGIAGLATVLMCLLVAGSGRPVPPLAGQVAGLTMAMLLVATVGGLGTAFAILVTPVIRGWDRAAIFINYGALLCGATCLQHAFEASFQSHARIRWFQATVIVLGVVAFLDQTPTNFRAQIRLARAAYETDRNFIQSIETRMPTGAALYQLPYLEFPETGPFNGMHAYDQLSGFINSRKLRWSFGGMQGREGDLTLRALSSEPIAEQLPRIRTMGYSAIYIDLRGYADHGKSIVAALTGLLGRPAMLTRADGNVVVFAL